MKDLDIKTKNKSFLKFLSTTHIQRNKNSNGGILV